MAPCHLLLLFHNEPYALTRHDAFLHSSQRTCKKCPPTTSRLQYSGVRVSISSLSLFQRATGIEQLQVLPKRSGQQLSENIHSGAINFHFLFKKCCISDLNFRSPAIIFGDINNTLAFLWCVPCSHSHTFTFNTLNCTSTFILASKPEDQASFLL